MNNSLKILLIFGLVISAITIITFNAYSQETESPSVTESVNLDEDVKPSDLGIKEVGVLPDNRFYFLKNWGRTIRTLFTFNPLAKTELTESFANERLMELKKMIEEGKNPEVIKKALEDYQKENEKVKLWTERIQEKAKDNKKVGKFLDKYTQQQLLHQRLLQKLENQVSTQALEKIKEVRTEHLDRFKDVMLKLEDKDKIPERLEKNLEAIKGSDFKEVKNLEILDELKDKLPTDIREKIEQIRIQMLEKLHKKLEELPFEDQQKFKEYLEKISGDKLKQLDIITGLEGEELSEKLKTIFEQIREKNIESIEVQYRNVTTTSERAQEKITQAEQSLAKAQTLITERNIEKEEMPAVYQLIDLAKEKLDSAKTSFQEGNFGRAFGQATASLSLSTNAIRIIETKGGFEKSLGAATPVCSLLKNPVCGTDGKTYNNICEAKTAGITISYRGECKAQLPCVKEGERANRNPLLGPISQVCCQGLEEIRTNRSYSICKQPGVSFECQKDEDCPLARCPGAAPKCVEGKCQLARCQQPIVCIQVITPAKSPTSTECREFPTPCDVPTNWIKVPQCQSLEMELQTGE